MPRFSRSLPIVILFVLVVGVGCRSLLSGGGAPNTPVVASIPVPSGEGPSPTPSGVVAPEDEGASPAPEVTPPGDGATPPDLLALRVELQPVVSGMQKPVGIANAGDGSGRLFVVEQQGVIRIVQDGVLLDEPFLDITDRVGSDAPERGLLGLAFHPDYESNGLFFVNYTDLEGDTVVARFSVSDEPNRADPTTGSLVLTLDQPAANHNGGNLVFGPDGYLYIGTGDGGGAGDQYGNGQNGQSLLGAMLRLDVNGGQPYAIPPDNPFVDDPDVLDEIWAIGLRNPWRYSFDRLTGDLYIADVGQNAYEEVDFQPADSPGGENYGWPIMEGLHCYPETVDCDPTGLVLPVVEYDHSGGNCSVTGGYVYRGQVSPEFSGVYLFADFCSGLLWGLARTADGSWQVAELTQTGIQISSFGEGEDGEVYAVGLRSGTLYWLNLLPLED